LKESSPTGLFRQHPDNPHHPGGTDQRHPEEQEEKVIKRGIGKGLPIQPESGLVRMERVHPDIGAPPFSESSNFLVMGLTVD